MLIVLAKTIYLLFVMAITILQLASKTTGKDQIQFRGLTLHNSTLPLILVITMTFPAVLGSLLMVKYEFRPFLFVPFAIGVIGGLVEVTMGLRKHGLAWLSKNDQELAQPRE